MKETEWTDVSDEPVCSAQKSDGAASHAWPHAATVAAGLLDSLLLDLPQANSPAPAGERALDGL